MNRIVILKGNFLANSQCKYVKCERGKVAGFGTA